MAMQPGSMMLSQPQPDGGEGFLMWLRGEFAAANAIIDGLCQHLRAVGEPGEYDGVIGSIQQRRCNWSPVLHMQQYFSVTEVLCALQHAGWRRQQRLGGFEGGTRREGRRGGGRFQNFGGEVNRKDFRNGNLKRSDKLGGDGVKDDGGVDDKIELKENFEVDGLIKKNEGMEGAVCGVEDEGEVADSCSVDGSRLVSTEKRNLRVTPKTFVATEICDGRPVNVAEGMKLYEELIDNAETLKLISLVHDLRAAGRQGKLQGESFNISKRPMKGHGREMIQFRNPSADAPSEDEATTRTSKDLKVEPIPALLQDIIERLLAEQVVSIKPDSCYIDIYSEGDHSHPFYRPQWFGSPICVLFLTECEMSFGKLMTVGNPGDYRGALRLSLSPGSMLVMQGNSTDFARHAIPSLQKQRILVTFTKSLSKRTNSSDHRFPPTPTSFSHLIPPPKHIRPAAGEHFGSVPPVGVLPASPAHHLIPPSNGIQQMYIPLGPVLPAIAFAVPPPRLPVPGTGFFLPAQGSSGNSPKQSSTISTEMSSTEAPALSVEDDDIRDSNDNSTSPKVDSQVPGPESTGTIQETSVGTVNSEVEQHQNIDSAGAAQEK